MQTSQGKVEISKFQRDSCRFLFRSSGGVKSHDTFQQSQKTGYLRLGGRAQLRSCGVEKCYICSKVKLDRRFCTQ